MNRRLAHTARHAPTGRDEAPEVPCTDRWDVYDVLIDQRGGQEWREALDVARSICSTCDLWTTCLRDNAEENWARAIITNRSVHGNAARCGTPAGHRNHRRHGEPACSPCSEAERLRSAKRREERAA